MTDIFREVDEELRQERLASLWKRYGTYVVAAVILIVGAVGGYRLYNSWQAGQSGESGAKFIAALGLIEEERFDEARPLLSELAEDGHGAYPTLARFQEAAVLAADGKRDDAVALYDRIAVEGGVETAFRDLARLRAAILLVDTAAPDEISRRVGDIAAGDGIWRHTAREALALSRYRAGDYARADEILDEIMADPAAPARLKSRAEIIRTLIAPKLGAEGG